MHKISLLLLNIVISFLCFAQQIPDVYKNLGKDSKGIYLKNGDRTIYAEKPNKEFKFTDLYGNPKAEGSEIKFNFNSRNLNGILYYGFITYGDGKVPQPVYFKRTSRIQSGIASVNIVDKMSGKYDMIGWEKKGLGVLGYRIINDGGSIIYDGKVAFSFKNNKLRVENTIIEGPFVNLLTPNGATISFTTTERAVASVKIDEKVFTNTKKSTNHEIKLTGLNPGTKYNYTVIINDFEFTYELETAPRPGSRKKFTFAYCSDSRAGKGGGERNISGTNAYIMKKMAALSKYEGVKFVQFTGDLINGYSNSKERMKLEYANWKHAVEPFWHHLPFYVGMGNHEAYSYHFRDTVENTLYHINHFPFDDNSAESLFMENFVNPLDGPESEDGSVYDPNLKKTDFPSYKESVYSYKYDNIAMVVLNSDYWFTPYGISKIGGNLHAYIMDNQLEWLEKTVTKYENDSSIDHIFVTSHTPCFPNGGHVGDDMWYNGNNKRRPVVGGIAVAKGIIERRDEILDILINKSKKTVAILTGDEHNYNMLTITDEMPRYPEGYTPEKVKLSRTFYQINNGAAGAPYYAQEETPWMNNLRNFSTQNALVLIDIDGDKVFVRVKNPDTLEPIDEYWLRK